MKKRNPLPRVLAALAALVLIALLFTIVNAFVGNPISSLAATVRIRAYVEKTYPDKGYEVPWASFNFKNHSYGSRVALAGSEDEFFRVSYEKGYIADDYIYAVENRHNTLMRLDDELRDAVRTLVEQDYPHATRLAGAKLHPREEEDTGMLTLDMPFDLYHLPLPVEVIVWTDAPTPDYETLAARLLELKALFDARGIRVDFYSLSLEKTYYTEKGELWPENFEENAGVYDMPAGEIVPEGLAARLEEMARGREADDPKAKEIGQ